MINACPKYQFIISTRHKSQSNTMLEMHPRFLCAASPRLYLEIYDAAFKVVTPWCPFLHVMGHSSCPNSHKINNSCVDGSGDMKTSCSACVFRPIVAKSYAPHRRVSAPEDLQTHVSGPEIVITARYDAVRGGKNSRDASLVRNQPPGGSARFLGASLHTG